MVWVLPDDGVWHDMVVSSGVRLSRKRSIFVLGWGLACDMMFNPGMFGY